MLPYKEGIEPPEMHLWTLITAGTAVAMVLERKGILTYDEIAEAQEQMWERLAKYIRGPEARKEEE